MSENEIQSIKTVMLQLINIVKSFAENVIQALNYLKRLPDLIETLGKKIMEGLRDQIQAMGEMEVYIRMARIRSKKELINLEKQSIEDLKEQLKDDAADIDKRYSKIQDGLNEDTYKRIRELDGHLVELYEKYYPQVFTDFFKERLGKYYDVYFSSSRDAYEERLSNFLKEVKETLLAMESFFNQRNQYNKNVEEYLFEDNPDKNENFTLPVCFVELENRQENKSSLKTFLPADFSYNSNSKKLKDAEPSLQEPHEFSVIKQHIENGDGMANLFEWDEEQDFKNNLSSELENFLFSSELPQGVLKAYLKNIEKSNIKTIKL